MPRRALDDADLRILHQLQLDGRLTNLELADRVGLSASPCLRRVRALEEDGVICGYTARLDLERCGLGIMAFVMVQLDRHGAIDAAAMRTALLRLPQIVACYVTSGEFDLLLQVVVPDLRAYRQFSLESLLTVPGIGDIRTNFVIETAFAQRPVVPAL